MYSSRNLEKEFFTRLHHSRPNLAPWLPLDALLILAWVSTGCAGRDLGQAATGTNTEALIFCDWEDDMPEEVLEAFTAEFGTPVTYMTYQDREQAIANLGEGRSYDVVVMDNREIPGLVRSALLAPLTPSNLTNLKNISPNFRDLVYDPGNRYTVPYNWGTTGLLVRPDLAGLEVTRWSDLWDPRLRGDPPAAHSRRGGTVPGYLGSIYSRRPG